MILLIDRSRRLREIDEPLLLVDGGGFHEFPRGGNLLSLPVSFTSGGGPPAPAPTAPPLDFDFDLSQIGRAVARGNTEADVRSAYELFSTGQTSGRALGYAQSDVARFGYPSLRHAAAAYLDAAGLPRLAQIVTPGPVSGGDTDGALGDFFGLPDPGAPVDAQTRSITDILADVFRQSFGQAVYNPPLQTQAYGASPVTVSGEGGGAVGLGLWLILGGLAIVAYFIYKRVSA